MAYTISVTVNVLSLAIALLLKAQEGLSLQAATTFSEDRESRPPPPEIICIGNNTKAQCVDPLDPNQCVPHTSKRAAVTFTFDQYIPWTLNETWYKTAAKAARANNADLLLLLPADEAPESDAAPESGKKERCNMLSVFFGSCKPKRYRIPIPESELAVIEKYFKIVRTPWVVPPGLSPGVPREGGCCGAREFMKLQALGLDEYDAVVNLDTDMSIIGSIQGLFDCAASGKFLSARGSMSGVNGGMFAAKPSKALLYDILMDLTLSAANDEDGWNNKGLAPQASYGQAGLQGFLYYFFHQKGSKHVTTGQLDPCAWTGAIFCEPRKACKSPLRHKLKCHDGHDDM